MKKYTHAQGEIVLEDSALVWPNALIDAIVTDPPYGGILSNEWDSTGLHGAKAFASYIKGILDIHIGHLMPNRAMYVWGGIGKPNNRTFFNLIELLEEDGMTMHNMITWSKKRAYGVRHNYLFTREELAYFVKGDPKQAIFNVPYLEKERGYEGFDPKHPAKSKFLRRTNVWSDITEIFRGKRHVAEKPVKLYEIPILTSTIPGALVSDPFAGSGTCAIAAIRTDRRFFCVEKDPESFEIAVERIKAE